MAQSLNNISISKIREMGYPSVICYDDRLIVTKTVSNLEIFHAPCRVDGVVIFVCLKGEIDCRIDLQEYHLTAGMLLVNFTSSIIQVEKSEDVEAVATLASYTYLDRLSLDYNSKLSLYMDVKRCAVASLPPVDVNAFVNIFSIMRKAMTDGREQSDAIVDSLVQALAHMVLDEMRAFSIRPSRRLDAKLDRAKRGELIFENFMTILATNRARERSLTYYAKELNISANYLSLMVRAFSGKGAVDWINSYTINEAKVLLRFSDLSVFEISQELSFPSQSSFGKFFKLYVGVNPSTYRRMERNSLNSSIELSKQSAAEEDEEE